MRKWIIVAGLIILIVGAFPVILRTLGFGGIPDRFPSSESRFPILMTLLIIFGVILMIVGVILSPSKMEGDGFRMKY